MTLEAWIILAGAVALLGLAWWLLPKWAAAARRKSFARLRREFFDRRERLEAQFFQVAAAGGKPRGLKWVACDFQDEVVFAALPDRNELAALVGMEISFEAIEGGGMEEVAAVANRKFASALFLTENRQWTTEGRAIMNLAPAEAVTHFGGQLERLPESA